MTEFTELPDYEWQLSILRESEELFAQAEREKTDENVEADEKWRKTIACNVLIAFNHLISEDSPFKSDLTEQDMRIVAMAIAVNDGPATQVLM